MLSYVVKTSWFNNYMYILRNKWSHEFNKLHQWVFDQEGTNKNVQEKESGSKFKRKEGI
jgi:hypothetical protein